MGVSPQGAYSDEAGAPKSIIQDGKKRIWSLMIVFMKIQPVTEISGELGHGEAGEFPGIIAGIE